MNPLLTLAELKQRPLVEERLKAIAAQLISAHRHHNHDLVIPYAEQAGLTVTGQAPHHLFMKAIQVYHPDRLSLVWDRIEAAVRASDLPALHTLAKLLEFHPDRPSPTRRPVDFETEEEEYEFEDDDWDPDEGTFYSAVKRELFGNLDLYPSPADLAKLEGELDLSDYDLHELDGIEHCRGLTTLNLSMNNLDNLYPLKDLIKLEALDLAENDLEDADWLGGLVNLRELDLSANDIDDVAFLDRLPHLRYVDLTGNPVKNKALIQRLEDRGVIVIL